MRLLAVSADYVTDLTIQPNESLNLNILPIVTIGIKCKNAWVMEHSEKEKTPTYLNPEFYLLDLLKYC